MFKNKGKKLSKWKFFNFLPSFFQKSPLKVIGSENIRNLPDASATKPTLKKSPNNKTKLKTDPKRKGEGVVTGRGRPTPCPYCQKIFSRSDVIRPHIMAVHPGEKVPIRVTSSPVVPPQPNKNKKKPLPPAAKTMSKDKAKSKNKVEAAASKKKKEPRRSEPPGMNAFHGKVLWARYFILLSKLYRQYRRWGYLYTTVHYFLRFTIWYLPSVFSFLCSCF
jgi:uncharacterized Zn-finger protein